MENPVQSTRIAEMEKVGIASQTGAGVASSWLDRL